MVAVVVVVLHGRGVEMEDLVQRELQLFHGIPHISYKPVGHYIRIKTIHLS